jgi:hypothetical protein
VLKVQQSSLTRVRWYFGVLSHGFSCGLFITSQRRVLNSKFGLVFFYFAAAVSSFRSRSGDQWNIESYKFLDWRGLWLLQFGKNAEGLIGALTFSKIGSHASAQHFPKKIGQTRQTHAGPRCSVTLRGKLAIFIPSRVVAKRLLGGRSSVGRATAFSSN